MDIVLDYDNSVNRAPAGFKTAMAYAAGVLDHLITNPITVTIDVGYGEVAGQSLGEGVLGESSPNTDTLPYSEVKSALAANAETPAAQEAVANLPAADPTGGTGVQVAYAEELALGLAPSNVYPVAGYVGFAPITPVSRDQYPVYFDYSTSGMPAANQYDFVGVAEHELTHALGRITNLGAYMDPLAPATVLDLFQYASPGVLAIGTAAPSYFSVDGGVTNLGTFDNTSDDADWSQSTGNDSFDAYANPGVINPITPVDQELMNVIGFQIACFAAGTPIRTARGDVAVEALRPGEDEAITAGGGCARIIWTGWRTLAPRRHPKPQHAMPVRVRANAVAEGQPRRDVVLSPDHALLLDESLVPVRHLVNGQTIAREPVDRVTYWHVELERHDVLLAEGLAVESYLDTGNRAAFANSGRVAMLTPEFARSVWAERGCAPLLEHGPRLVALRRHLSARAAQLGWRTVSDPALRLRSANRSLPLGERDGLWRAELPADAGRLHLLSRTWIPEEAWADGTDPRRLGVAVAKLWLDGEEVAPDNPALGAGWHAAEPGWRWTAGAACIDATGARHLAFRLAMTGFYSLAPSRPMAALSGAA